MTLHNKQSTGFALLMSLIVVSVVVSIGLVVLDLTLKQLRLSTNSKYSETAFHAANAAMECARYWRNVKDNDFTYGDEVAVNCFEDSLGISPDPIPTEDNDGEAAKYSFIMNDNEYAGISWGDPESRRCSQIDILVLNSDIAATTTVEDMPVYIPGFPEEDKECPPGGRCTVIAARGYSRACDQISQPGTVEREVLLEL